MIVLYACRLVKGLANKVNNVVKILQKLYHNLKDWWWIWIVFKEFHNNLCLTSLPTSSWTAHRLHLKDFSNLQACRLHLSHINDDVANKSVLLCFWLIYDNLMISGANKKVEENRFALLYSPNTIHRTSVTILRNFNITM